MNYRLLVFFDVKKCGEPGIRTLEALLELTHFPGVRLRPLGQLSGIYFCYFVFFFENVAVLLFHNQP
jgi:hypothetical protein